MYPSPWTKAFFSKSSVAKSKCKNRPFQCLVSNCTGRNICSRCLQCENHSRPIRLYPVTARTENLIAIIRPVIGENWNDWPGVLINSQRETSSATCERCRTLREFHFLLRMVGGKAVHRQWKTLCVVVNNFISHGI